MLYKKLALIAFIAALCIFLTSCSKTLSNTEVYSAEKTDSKYHTSSSDTEKIASSDFAELYFDKTTFSVSVKDKSNNRLWKSLPEKQNSSAFAFAVTLYTKNGIYELNTQDNSVAFESAFYEKGENSVTVSYVLSDNAETAKKSYEEMSKNDIYVSFPVTYTLKEQALVTSIDLSNAKCTKGAFISEISYLPYLGASYDDSIQDYFLVPDGSGAVMYTSNSDSETDSVSISVYGADPYSGSNENKASAVVPVFGVKRNNNAFAAVITDGDALATINASRKSGDEPSKANAQFSVTTVKQAEDGTIYYGNSYEGCITVVYKFLSDTSADYVGMASAAREEFINNGTLPTEKYDSDSGSIPFCVTVIGSQDDTVLTTIQQALDITDTLKGKGIDNILLNFKGLLSGGYAQKNLYYSGILKELGGKDGYAEFYNYAKRQNYTLYTDINIFSSSKSYSALRSAATIDGEDSFYNLKNDLAFRNYSESRLSSRIGSQTASIGASKRNPSIYSSVNGYNMYLTSADKISKRLSAFLSGDIANMSSGFSVNDAGYILASSDSISRQEAKDIIASQIKTIANYGSLAVKGGNIYTLYAADFVSEMEFDTHYTESSAYEPVPFMQSVIHGCTLYSGKAIDAADPLYRYDMLQAIEYGAMPSFEWVYNASSIFCYDGYLLAERISEISDYYERANDALKDVSDAAITSHRKITTDTDGKSITGVYCTSYSNGTEIYVNYTGNAVVTPENIVVGAYDFIKITR